MASLITFSPSTTIKSADVNSNFTNLANGSAMTSPSIASPTFTTKFVATGLYDNGNSSTAITLNWTNGDRQKLTVSANTTISFSGAVSGQIVTFLIVENSTGNFTITLPTIKWPGGSAGVFTTTANAINILSVFYDGTNYYGELASGMA